MEFLELFLPEFAATIDSTSVTFLQQEYFIDLVEGEEKIVDLLAEVKLAGGGCHDFNSHGTAIYQSDDFSTTVIFLLCTTPSKAPEANLPDRNLLLR